MITQSIPRIGERPSAPDPAADAAGAPEVRYIRALVTDIDRTIAQQATGVNTPGLVEVFADFARHGARRIVATGRMGKFDWSPGPGGITNAPLLRLIDDLLLEGGGARIHHPHPHLNWTHVLAKRHSHALVRELRRVGVPSRELWIGRAAIGTMTANHHLVLEAVNHVNARRRRWHLRPLQVCPTFNNSTVGYLPPGVDKATSAERSLHKYGIDWSEVVAAGDGLNDLPMMRRAAIAIVPSNGVDVLKRLPNAIVGDKPGVEGVLDVMRRLLAGQIAGFHVGNPGRGLAG